MPKHTKELQDLLAVVARVTKSHREAPFQSASVIDRLCRVHDAYEAATKPPLPEQVEALLPKGWGVDASWSDDVAGEMSVDGPNGVRLYFYDDSPLTAQEIVDMALKLEERK